MGSHSVPHCWPVSIWLHVVLITVDTEYEFVIVPSVSGLTKVSDSVVNVYYFRYCGSFQFGVIFISRLLKFVIGLV